MDNSEFTEEQRAEAHRVESMQHMRRQTAALESIRGFMLFFFVVFFIGAFVYLAVLATASS